MKDETLISELEYCLDINIINHPEVHNLVLRAIRELKMNKNELSKLKRQAYLDSWSKNPDRMGGSFSDHEIAEASAWR